MPACDGDWRGIVTGSIAKWIKKVPGLTWGAIILVLAFVLFAPGFSKPQNIVNILRSASILFVVACGMTMAILSQQIDMSIGGVMSFSAMVCGVFMKQYENPGVLQILSVIALGLVIGLAFGLFNGIMIGKLKYNYWLVTFSTMSIGFGAAQVVTAGSVVSGFGKAFRNITSSSLAGIPSVVFIALAIAGFMLLLTTKTLFGMHIYAVGDSEQCSEQSGINVPRVRVLIYILSGLLAGLGGVLIISRTNSASPIVASGYEFDAIAAVIIGGTPFDGGKGGIAGTIAGATIMVAISNGLQLMGLSNYWQQVLTGVFILSIIIIDVSSERRKRIAGIRRIYKHG
jgi:ribose/xylose/arabinose/galactoside ABC-type transport system permease subunit